MVKHSKDLESKMVPQWKQGYINYASLEGTDIRFVAKVKLPGCSRGELGKWLTPTLFELSDA